MDESKIENLIDNIIALRENKEIIFIINRLTTHLSIQPGDIWANLVSEGADLDELQQVLHIVTPIIIALVSEDENSVINSIALAKHQFKSTFDIDIDSSWIADKLNPLITYDLKKTYLHRSSAQGNLFMAISAALLSRHHKTTYKKYPFVQLRMDYLDNNKQNADISYVQFEVTKEDLMKIREAIDGIVDKITEFEEDSVTDATS